MQQYSTLIFIALLVAAFYFLILRPQRKRQQALQQTMNALSPGSRVMLGSGLFGTVVSVGPRQVVLEISPGAELTVLKQAISKVVTEDDEDRLDEQDELEEDETATPMSRLSCKASGRWRRRRRRPVPSLPSSLIVPPRLVIDPRDSKPPTAD